MTEPLFTSLISLIARPADHDGARIRVIGCCVLGFEANGLFVSELDARAAITKNGLWLDVGPDFQALSGRVVLVEGTFDAANQGHLRMYSGSIVQVTRFQAWGT